MLASRRRDRRYIILHCIRRGEVTKRDESERAPVGNVLYWHFGVYVDLFAIFFGLCQCQDPHQESVPTRNRMGQIGIYVYIYCS